MYRKIVKDPGFLVYGGIYLAVRCLLIVFLFLLAHGVWSSGEPAPPDPKPEVRKQSKAGKPIDFGFEMITRIHIMLLSENIRMFNKNFDEYKGTKCEKAKELKEMALSINIGIEELKRLFVERAKQEKKQ